MSERLFECSSCGEIAEIDDAAIVWRPGDQLGDDDHLWVPAPVCSTHCAGQPDARSDEGRTT